MPRLPRQPQPFCLGILYWALTLTSGWALEPPPNEVQGKLGSESYSDRMGAQGALREWALRDPEPAKGWLFEHSVGDPDPEIRKRCTAVLKDLIDQEYLKDGEGYIGILMMAIPQVQVPGEKAPRVGITVNLVVPGSAAAKAGLVVGDVIVEAGDQIWNDAVTAVPQFSTWVRSHRPGEKVTIKILKNGKVIPLDLVLGRRPPESGVLMLGELPDSSTLAREEQEAKDAYFREWFENRKAGK